MAFYEMKDKVSVKSLGRSRVTAPLIVLGGALLWISVMAFIPGAQRAPENNHQRFQHHFTPIWAQSRRPLFGIAPMDGLPSSLLSFPGGNSVVLAQGGSYLLTVEIKFDGLALNHGSVTFCGTAGSGSACAFSGDNPPLGQAYVSAGDQITFEVSGTEAGDCSNSNNAYGTEVYQGMGNIVNSGSTTATGTMPSRNAEEHADFACSLGGP